MELQTFLGFSFSSKSLYETVEIDPYIPVSEVDDCIDWLIHCYQQPIFRVKIQHKNMIYKYVFKHTMNRHLVRATVGPMYT